MTAKHGGLSFCGTVRQKAFRLPARVYSVVRRLTLASAGYAASRPAEFGLSSPDRDRERFSALPKPRLTYRERGIWQRNISLSRNGIGQDEAKSVSNRSSNATPALRSAFLSLHEMSEGAEFGVALFQAIFPRQLSQRLEVAQEARSEILGGLHGIIVRSAQRL